MGYAGVVERSAYRNMQMKINPNYFERSKHYGHAGMIDWFKKVYNVAKPYVVGMGNAAYNQFR